MKHSLPPCLLLLLPLLLPACTEEDGREAAQLSPQELYEKGRALLQPNIEHSASDFAAALDYTRQAAEKGWRQAQTDMGWLFMNGGKGVTINHAEALKWFREAAEQGSKEAEYFIGELYYRGLDGIRGDTAEAMKHWRIAAEAGIAEAQQRLGLLLSQQQQTFSEGLEWLRRAATEGQARGKAEAALNLGNIYATGKGGVVANLEEAARWYAMAAEEGSARAQHVYGLMLLGGEAVAQDVQSGLFMLRRAASQDYLPAMADFINQLRNHPEATEEEQKEADAWSKRLEELMMKRRKPAAAPVAQPEAAN